MYKDFKESYSSSSYNVEGNIIEISKERVDYTVQNGRTDLKKQKTFYTVLLNDEKIFSYFADNEEFSDVELIENVLKYAVSDEAAETLDSVDKLMKMAFESPLLTEEQKEDYFKSYLSVNEDYTYILSVLKNKNIIQKAVDLMKDQAEAEAKRKASTASGPSSN